MTVGQLGLDALHGLGADTVRLDRAAQAAHPAWLNRWGRPLGSKAIRAQIKSRTQLAFCKAIWPHLFRDCAVTELVDCAPEGIGIAPNLLDLRTTRKHYIQAQGMTAHVRVQGVIAARRQAAAVRRSSGA